MCVCTDSYLHYLNANDEDIKKNIYIYLYISFMCVLFCFRVFLLRRAVPSLAYVPDARVAKGNYEERLLRFPRAKK